MAKKKSGRNKPPNDRLQVLGANLKPVPFLPQKNHEFFTHEDLFKQIGLWDFANLDFDSLSSEIEPDLVAQLIANFDLAKGWSFVNGVKVSVCQAELARALKLPEKIDGGFEGIGTATKESIRFIEGFVYDWIVLRGESDDAWIVPSEISDSVKAVRERRFEKVDWAGMVWFMVEKELLKGRELKDCYYALHMMCLIKGQIKIVSERSVELSNLEVCKAKIEDPNSVIDGEKAVIDAQNDTIEAQNRVIELSNLEVCKAKIEDPNSVIDGEKVVIDAQNDTIEAQNRVIDKLKGTIEAQNVVIDKHRVNIEAQNATINAKNETVTAQKALIVKLQSDEGSNKAGTEERNGYIRVQKVFKAKIAAQEKEHTLMVNLLKGYQEALKRTQMEFREFREKCECKNLHEPIYRDVPGSSGLVLSVGEIEKRGGDLAVEVNMRGLKI